MKVGKGFFGLLNEAKVDGTSFKKINEVFMNMQHLTRTQITDILKLPASKWEDETKRFSINKQLITQLITDIKVYYVEWLRENNIIGEHENYEDNEAAMLALETLRTLSKEIQVSTTSYVHSEY